MSELLTFERFQPGAAMGVASETVDEDLLKKWHALYPQDPPCAAGEVPVGIATVLMMRAYIQVLNPRPPGNIHAGQHFTLSSPIECGETVRTEMRCVGKTLRGERRFVEFAVRATGRADRLLFTGSLNLIWAA